MTDEKKPSTKEEPRIEVKRDLVFSEGFKVPAGDLKVVEVPIGVDSRHIRKLHEYVKLGTIVLHGGAQLPPVPEPAAEAAKK